MITILMMTILMMMRGKMKMKMLILEKLQHCLEAQVEVGSTVPVEVLMTILMTVTQV
jgi:hypothetical protein